MSKITIERTTANGYETSDHEVSDAIKVINDEIENGKTVFIDNKPIDTDLVTEDILLKCKKEVSIVNKLIGG